MINHRHPQQPKERQRTDEEVLQRYRKAWPRSTPMLQKVTEYTKKIGALLIVGLKSLYKIFQQKLSENIEKKQATSILDQGEGKNGQTDKRKGFRVNFKEFQCDDKQLQNYQEPERKNESEMRPVRSYIFRPQDQQNLQQDEKQSDDGHEIYRDNYGHKVKLLFTPKKEPTITSMLAARLQEPEWVRERLSKIYNEVHMVRMNEYIENQEKIQKRKKYIKQNGLEMDEMYKNYLRSLGLNPQENPSHKRLATLMRQRKARIEQAPPRKLTHIQNDPPPIYCVDKVLQVLEKQREQFMSKRREQHEKMKQEARKLEEQIREKERKFQQERRLLQKEEKELNKKMLQQEQQEQQQQQQQQEQNVSEQYESREQYQGQNSKSRLSVIQQNEQPNEIPHSQQQEINLTLNRQNKSQYQSLFQPKEQILKKCEQPKPNLFTSPKQIKKSEQGSNALFSTPQKKVQEQQPLVVLPISVQGQQQPKQSDKKNNPFIRNSPVKLQTLQDLINKDQKQSNLFQFLPSNPVTIAPTIFNQTTPVTNLFSNVPAPVNNMQAMVQPQRQDISNSFQSPTNFMNNPIGGGFLARQPLQPSMFQMASPSSMANNPNSSNHSSNLPTYNNNDISPGFGQGQILGTQSGPATMGDGRGMLGSFATNPQAARLFQNNLFRATPPQQQSLFGASPVAQTNRDYSNQRGNRKKGGQIRIS